MVDDTPHGPGPGKVPTQGSHTDHWETTEAAGGWDLGLPDAGYGDAGGRVQRNGRICPEESECGRAIHCKADDSGPIQEDGADSIGVGS